MSAVDWVCKKFSLESASGQLSAITICSQQASLTHAQTLPLAVGICQDILKEQCPRGLLAKNEHFGQIFSEIVAQLCLENVIQTLLNFLGSTN